ncbi:NAD(P)-dependent oxidoreductase [Paenibacillus nasutitermitis]|uniref:3-hydroxyisobutyrate dehydrogenase n=1 Tax=Paenibacillus nasutitermitis TaxID=1652958 RepID=A0A917E1C0_9BACL|nr:NAD(P)-dependent oxidoreductase [Paenibacillus nasutitermitis]GGD89130.1 3-hydroxyisobutyrate dehydrogenase [Paenibacillus nasutitermitis]
MPSNSNAAKPAVGFIGIGVMGKSIVRNLMKAGYSLHVSSRTKSKAEDILQEGACWHDQPAEVAKHADVVMTMLGYPHDVEDVYYGEQGLLKHAAPDSVFVDLTTSSPELAVRLEQSARERDCFSLDAPVSGGDIGAREAKLSIMVGGSEEVFQRIRPIFEAIGTNIVYQGPAGAGQHTKMCNQIAIAANMLGVCEALRYAEKAGLDPDTVLKSIGSGAAGSWSLNNLAPRMIAGDFEPGFYVKHFIKDMGIALESAEAMGLEAHGLSLAKSLYERLAQAGEADSGTQALYKLYK